MIIGIFGPSRSGKDEAANWFVDNCGFKYDGTTSVIISQEVAKRENITFEQAHEQRHKRKLHWRMLGDIMRKHDPAALARAVLADGSNLLVGVRAKVEMDAVIRERLTHFNIWIARNVPFDPTLEFGVDSCDVIVPNYWSLRKFHTRLWSLARGLGLKAKHEGPVLK